MIAKGSLDQKNELSIGTKEIIRSDLDLYHMCDYLTLGRIWVKWHFTFFRKLKARLDVPIQGFTNGMASYL